MNEMKPDNKGLYDNLGLIDTLIEDCNEITKDLIDNQFVRFNQRIVFMAQKLSNLKSAIKNDQESLEKQIRDLREMIDDINKKE